MDPPSEQQILSQFLLPPAPLQQLITLEAFTALFPRSQRSSPAVKSLYLQLQQQRALDIDAVSSNISIEVKQGEKLRKELTRVRTKGEDPLDGMAGVMDAFDPDVADVTLFNTLRGTGESERFGARHTISTVIPAMRAAVEEREEELERLREEERRVRKDVEMMVGGLSDLRYGRFDEQRGGLGKDAVESLRSLSKNAEAGDRMAIDEGV